MRRGLRWIAGTALAVALLLAFPYGPLFPWSPIHPGYQRIRLRRADIFYPSGGSMRPVLANVDSYIDEAEAYHRLRFHERVTVVDSAGWGDFHRFEPTHRRGRPASVALWTGTVIYLSPLIAERRLDAGEFLRHELSHAVLHQNASIFASARMNRENWLLEGLAVAYGRQHAYLTPSEFVARAGKQDLLDSLEPSRTPRDMRFFYCGARYFLEYMMATRGRDRFQLLLDSFRARPLTVRERFGEIYGLAWPDAVREFQDRVRSGQLADWVR